MSGTAQLKIDWKTSTMTPTNSSGPHTGWSATASILSPARDMAGET
jgi:hypothetical protein